MIYSQNGILFSQKRDEVLINGITWMNLEKIMLSERSQSQFTFCMILFT